MNFENFLNEQFTSNIEFIIGEGIFSISPTIAMFAFKDDVLGKISKTAQSVKDSRLDIKQKIETLKAHTVGKSGDKDDDIVYKYTKEQKKILAQIYKKYGAKVIREIDEFRKNVTAPYQVIKKEVAKNYMSKDSTKLGMTKEEYYRYRESGRRKIEKMGSFVKDHRNAFFDQSKALQAIKEAQKTYLDFKANKNYDISAANLEKLLDDAGLGLKELKGWSLSELSNTISEIERLEDILKTANSSNPDEVKKVRNAHGKIRIFGSDRANNAVYVSDDDLQYRISELREKGISKVNNRKRITINKTAIGTFNVTQSNPYGNFESAMSLYLLRRDEIQKLKNACLSVEYRRFYKDILKNAIKTAKNIYKDKYENLMGLRSSIELNEQEKKIWKLKLLGNEFSGNINDWTLKIKPEDFEGVKYNKKSEKIVQAEKDFDRELKRFERSLMKVMSKEDVDLCKKYKLFNNFLTIKQLKDPKNLFKTDSEIEKQQQSSADIADSIDNILEKSYSSLKDLESAQTKLRRLISDVKLSQRDKERCDDFLSLTKPKEEINDNHKLTELIQAVDKINNSYYTKSSAKIELDSLESKIEYFEKHYGKVELRPYMTSINAALDKLNVVIRKEGA